MRDLSAKDEIIWTVAPVVDDAASTENSPLKIEDEPTNKKMSG